MGFKKLLGGDEERFYFAPEVHMDLQVGKQADGSYVMVIGGRVSLTIDQDLLPQMQVFPDFAGRSDEAAPIPAMERWRHNLPASEGLTPVESLEEALEALGFLHLGYVEPFPPVLVWPMSVYGHLPFHGICSGKEVFYRYEAFPTSRRISLDPAGVITPNTFATPMSELPFIPTGLAAVARYALPSLLPACWRYELRPPVNTPVRYGACVPAFGQSGGGVEVMFQQPFGNMGSIALPIVLPIF